MKGLKYYGGDTCRFRTRPLRLHSRRLDQLDQGNNILKVLDRLRIWPKYLTLPFVGKRASHNRLSCSQDRHQFQWPLANSCGKLNRFSFGTFFLAGFGDCGLLELHLLVLSHMSPCELHVCSYCRTISRFWLYRRVHFCFIVIRFSNPILDS